LSDTSPVVVESTKKPLPPPIAERSSSLSNLVNANQGGGSSHIQFKNAPPMYIADNNWTTSFELLFSKPLTSHCYCSRLGLIVATTAQHVSVFQSSGGSLIFESDLKEYYKSHPKLSSSISITFSKFLCFGEWKCVLVTTTQSLFAFRIIEKTIVPFFAFHCETDFGVVCLVEGVTKEGHIAGLFDEINKLVVVTNSTVLVFQVGRDGLNQGSRKVLDESIVKSGLVRIDGILVWFGWLISCRWDVCRCRY
jgi:hypothetical protein